MTALVTHIDFLVEGYSMKRFLEMILPKILSSDVTCEIFDLGSKSQFIKKFPKRLAGYSSWMQNDRRIVLLVDADQDDCYEFRSRLLAEIRKSGLTVTSLSSSHQGQVLLCIVIEMLEARLFGDTQAIGSVYGKQFMSVGAKKGYRRPDEIRDPALRLQNMLKRVPKHRAGLKKADLVSDVVPHMDVDNNASISFCRFRDGVRFLINSSQESYAPSN
jgi:hypothetical protein